MARKPKAYAGTRAVEHTYFAKPIKGRVLLPPFEELAAETDTGRWISSAVMRSAREINRRPLAIDVEAGAWFGRDVLVITFSGVPLEDAPQLAHGDSVVTARQEGA